MKKQCQYLWNRAEGLERKKKNLLKLVRALGVILIGSISFLPLTVYAEEGKAAITQSKPRACVIANYGVSKNLWDPKALKDISTTLNTTLTKYPTEQQFLNKVKENDVLYINTHIYGSVFNLIDRVEGRKGSMVVGDSAWVGRNDADTVTPDEVTETLREAGHNPQLVVIVGCEADKYDWSQAFNAQTTITFRIPVNGGAGDIYFSHFFEGWMGGKTVDEALVYANSAVYKDPRIKGTILKQNQIKGIIKQQIVYGDRQIKYLGGTGNKLSQMRDMLETIKAITDNKDIWDHAPGETVIGPGGVSLESQAASGESTSADIRSADRLSIEQIQQQRKDLEMLQSRIQDLIDEYHRSGGRVGGNWTQSWDRTLSDWRRLNNIIRHSHTHKPTKHKSGCGHTH